MIYWIIFCLDEFISQSHIWPHVPCIFPQPVGPPPPPPPQWSWSRGKALDYRAIIGHGFTSVLCLGRLSSIIIHVLVTGWPKTLFTFSPLLSLWSVKVAAYMLIHHIRLYTICRIPISYYIRYPITSLSGLKLNWQVLLSVANTIFLPALELWCNTWIHLTIILHQLWWF